jgi:hypothetical protein
MRCDATTGPPLKELAGRPGRRQARGISVERLDEVFSCDSVSFRFVWGPMATRTVRNIMAREEVLQVNQQPPTKPFCLLGWMPASGRECGKSDCCCLLREYQLDLGVAGSVEDGRPPAGATPCADVR